MGVRAFEPERRSAAGTAAPLRQRGRLVEAEGCSFVPRGNLVGGDAVDDGLVMGEVSRPSVAATVPFGLGRRQESGGLGVVVGRDGDGGDRFESVDLDEAKSGVAGGSQGVVGGVVSGGQPTSGEGDPGPDDVRRGPVGSGAGSVMVASMPSSLFEGGIGVIPSA